MNNQKLTNLFTNSKTNWKYILIVVILASFAGGGILYYQWWISAHEVKLLEEQILERAKKEKEILPTENSHIQQEIVITTDKTEYERTEPVPVIFTIKNVVDEKVFSNWAGEGVGFDVTFENYNEERKIWEVAEKIFFISQPFLNADESVQFKAKLFRDLSKSVNIQQKLRIAVQYLYHENCNPLDCLKSIDIREFCYKKTKTAYSNEFIVKESTEFIIKEELIPEASEFCYQRKERLGAYWYHCFEVLAAGDSESYVGPSFYFNFDEDQDKEILGSCEPDLWGGYMVIFVLDKKDDEYKTVLIKDRGKENYGQRYFNFADLRVRDIDKDGIDEIIFYESGWYGGGGDNYLHLYSPKYNEWFWRNDWWAIDIESGERSGGTNFSVNLDLEKYKVFKEFLLKQ